MLIMTVKSTPVLLTNIRLEKKITLTGPGANVIQLFTSVIYECPSKARLFVPGKPFQPSIMLVEKIQLSTLEWSIFQVLHMGRLWLGSLISYWIKILI